MSMKQEKVVINCAVTGSIHIPSQSEFLPLTPQQISAEAIKAANAGAGTVHIHVRNPQTGQPSSDLGLFKEVCSEIHRKSNVVVCPTTGGGLGMTPQERVRVVAELQPELATCNMGSFNYGLFPLLNKFKDFKYDWEKQYLEMTRNFIFSNTFQSLEVFMKTFQEAGDEAGDGMLRLGHLYNIAHMADRGFIQKTLLPPFYYGDFRRHPAQPGESPTHEACGRRPVRRRVRLVGSRRGTFSVLLQHGGCHCRRKRAGGHGRQSLFGQGAFGEIERGEREEDPAHH